MASFIGRTNDAAVIVALLTSDERLVTITGPAGIGKTRLACEVISTLSSGCTGHPPVPVIECDLVDARTRDDVAAALALAVGAHASGPDVFASIGARLARFGALLLFLDGFERIAHAQDVLRPLLDAAPRLQVLVTSQAALGLDTEQVHELGPLSPQDGLAIARERLASRDGCDVIFDEVEMRALARSVAATGGVPLAHELVAFCVARLGATQVAQRLARLDASVPACVPLEEIVALSWQVLDSNERRMLASCSVFRGGFTAEAAVAVAGDDLRAKDAMQSLTNEAVIVPPRHARHDRSSARRVLHRAIREYAAEHLDLEGDTRARHATYFIEAGEVWAREASNADGKSSFERLALERANLLEVVEHALGRDDGTSAARGLLVLVPMVLASGPVEPYLGLVNRALRLAMPIDQRILLLAARGKAHRRMGHIEAADRDQHEAVNLARRAGFRREEARLLGELGTVAYARCDFGTALTLFKTALTLQTLVGDAAEQAITLTELAKVHRELGSLTDARSAAMRALPIHRSTGDATHIATTLVELARCDIDEGDLGRARIGLSSAWEIASDNPVIAALVRCLIAKIEHAVGNLELAEQEYAAAIHVSREVAHARLEGGAYVYLGLLSLDRGDLGAAIERLEHGGSLLREAGDVRYGALATGYLAACALLTDDGMRAVTLFAESRALIGEDDVMRTAIDTFEAALTSAPLPPRALEHASSSWESRHALERWERRAGNKATETVEPDCVFQVAESGAWMEHQGRHVECGRRAATQRLLGALARGRADAPGRPIPTGDLVLAGWPNEQITSAAAKNRLRVALSWLRKNGLGPALMSHADGYYLDPELVGVIAEPATTELLRRN